MKKTLKLSLSLIGNQFLASIGGAMCILFAYFLAGDTIMAHVIFLLFSYPFFIYIEYRSAFYHGFHDSNRRNAPDSKSYLFKGALAGLISAVPMLILIIVYVACYDNVIISQSAKLYARAIAMYYNWPMCNIFPNHTLEVLLSSLVGLIVFPMIGYIAGYKNFVISDKIYKALKIKPSK